MIRLQIAGISVTLQPSEVRHGRSTAGAPCNLRWVDRWCQKNAK